MKYAMLSGFHLSLMKLQMFLALSKSHFLCAMLPKMLKSNKCSSSWFKQKILEENDWRDFFFNALKLGIYINLT